MPSSTAELKKLKVTELRDQLANRGLDTKGVKDDLITRLAEAMDAEGLAAGEPALEAVKPALVAPEIAVDAVSSAVMPAPTPPSTDPAAGDTAIKSKKESEAPLLTEEERKRLRAERFRMASVTDDKEKPAPNVGICGLDHFDPAEEFERRKKRAERFGLPIPVSAAEELVKKKARAERFGLQVPLTKEEVEAQKKARAERFGINGGAALGSTAAEAIKQVEEEKKKLEARAKRFAAIDEAKRS